MKRVLNLQQTWASTKRIKLYVWSTLLDYINVDDGCGGFMQLYGRCYNFDYDGYVKQYRQDSQYRDFFWRVEVLRKVFTKLVTV